MVKAMYLNRNKITEPKMEWNKKQPRRTETTKIKELDSIFKSDSIVRLNPIRSALGTQGEVEIYSKQGKKLLRLSPDNEQDPNAVITSVQIIDERYTTAKGLRLTSTFKDLKEQYEIAGIQTSIDAVIVSLKNSDVYVTINKSELPENLRYNPSISIEATQIPDKAIFKYFMLSWNEE